MNFNNIQLTFLCLLLSISGITFGQKGRVDTLIVIKQPSKEQIAKRDSIKKSNEALVQKEAKDKSEKENIQLVEKNKATTNRNSLDSSRFVQRKYKLRDSYVGSKVPFAVNRAVFGVYTDYINQYIDNYRNNHGSRLSRMQSNNRAQFKLIDNVMKRYSVPREMKALAIIESAMNCNAVSPVGAVGTWQFMEGTAKMMGLRVDEEVDERRDIYKSTNAAAKYLKKLHGMFHDWLLVIASYNCGPAPVLRAINSGNGRSFWDIKPKLPKETQNHVMAFIATNAFLDRFTSVLTMGESPKPNSKLKVELPKSNKKIEARTTIISKTIKPLSNKDVAKAQNNDNNDDSVADDIKEEEEKPKFTKADLDQMAILKVKGNYTLAVISRVLDEDLVKLRRWNPTFDEDILKATSPIHLRLPIDKIEKFIIEREKIIAQSKK
jgi:membrane-bound lytic murein transglycosylase D